MLELAKRRLTALDFVGLSSRFDESMELMAWNLGFSLQRFCSCNVNQFKSKIERSEPRFLSDKAKEAVANGNALDMELYKYASDLFEKRFAEFKRATMSSSNARAPFMCDKSGSSCRVKIDGCSGLRPGARLLRGAVKQRDSVVRSAHIAAMDFYRIYSDEINSGRKKSDCSFECTREVFVNRSNAFGR